MQPAWIKRRWRIFKKAGDAPCVRLLARLVTGNLKTQCGPYSACREPYAQSARSLFANLHVGCSKARAPRAFPFPEARRRRVGRIFFQLFAARFAPRVFRKAASGAQIPRHSRVTASAAYLNYAAFFAANPTPVARLPANDHRRAVELSIPQKVFLRRGAWRFSCKPPNACLTSGFRRFAPKRRA